MVHIDGTPIHFFIVKRAHKYGVRARDYESDVLKNFKGRKFFPISPHWVIPAELRPHEKTLDIVNFAGLPEPHRSTGSLHFTVNGEACSMDVVDDGEEELWLIFKDLTSGVESYGMRFLYVPRPPPSSNTTYIDFNKSYTPWCGFTQFATCPLPPKQNRLSVRIEAGEIINPEQQH